MPIDYTIDHERRLVHATGHGKITDQDVFGYQREVWSQAEVAGYDELVDMSDVQRIVVPTTERLKELVGLAAEMDPPNAPSKFAIVAPDELAYDLGRFFKIYRELDPRSTKEVNVFRNFDAAIAWLGIGEPK